MASFVQLTNGQFFNMAMVMRVIIDEATQTVICETSVIEPNFKLRERLHFKGQDADLIREWLKQQCRPEFMIGGPQDALHGLHMGLKD